MSYNTAKEGFTKLRPHIKTVSSASIELLQTGSGKLIRPDLVA